METYINYPDHFVDIQGIRTRYWTTGNGNKTLVLLHGHGGSVLEWTYNYRAFEKNFKVVALDLPGHGKTGKPHIRYNYDFFVSFLNDFLATLGIDKMSLLGHSMGGMISLYFITKYPSKLEKLILISPAYGTTFPFFFNLMTVPFLGEMLFKLPVSIMDLKKSFEIITYNKIEYDPRVLEGYFEFQHSPGYVHAMLSYLRSALNLFGLNKQGRAYHNWFEQKLPDITQPVLLLWGKQDRVVPVANGRQLRNALPPHAQYLEMDKCGHSPIFEYPEEFNDRVVRFLTEVTDEAS